MKIIFLVLLFLGLSAAAVVDSQNINVEQLVKIRCSLNVEDETFFFFNGSVIAYLTGSTTENRVLFKTVGINVGRCFKVAENNYVMASRELLYYIDTTTDEIINTWTNPWTTEQLVVAHVDNDPVLQTFTSATAATLPPVQIYEDAAFMNLDIPLRYPNPLANNATFAPYSPQPWYQAGEFFKFIFPIENLENDKNTVDSVLVSWTREGPFLPWMKMGNITGHLIYSSSGARIPSYEYLSPKVVADLNNRIPHYKHAPLCRPNTTSVTSWTFFRNHFSEWLAGDQFPLATAAVYPCVAGTEIPEPTPTAAPTPTPAPVCSGAFSVTSSFVALVACILAMLF